jgi:hypothetical protein
MRRRLQTCGFLDRLALPLTLLVIATSWSGGSFLSSSTVRAESPPEFSDVAPILYARCAGCHRPGRVAPMSLLTFDQVRPWARAIKNRVLSRAMPPWGAQPGVGEFRNSRALTQDEIETLVQWVDAGAPRGEKAPPPIPSFPAAGWNSLMDRPPDQVVELPIEFALPAAGEIPTFTVWSKLPFVNDRMVEAIEVLPSNPSVVHHAGVSVGDLPPGTRMGRGELWPGGPMSEGVAILNDGQTFKATMQEHFGYPLIFYVPDGGLLRFPRGAAKRLPAHKYFAWGMHLVSTGRVERVHVTMGLWFAPEPVSHEVETMTVNEKVFVGGKEVPPDGRGGHVIPHIPPYASNWEVVGTFDISADMTLYSLWPHMHYRGKDMTFTVTEPDGDEAILLRVPKYDPRWQTTYELAVPRRVPQGSTIRAVAHYDNSAGNPLNPAPDEEVVWGPQSWNEMFHPFIEASVEPPLATGRGSAARSHDTK